MKELVRCMKFFYNINMLPGTKCWLWLNFENKGRSRPVMYWGVDSSGKSIYKPATHVAYWIEHGVWPTYIEHTCDNELCCNPAHLLESNHQANMKSMIERGRQNNQKKTHCSQGHDFKIHGTVHHLKDGRSRRTCRVCAKKSIDNFKARQVSGS